MKPLVIEHELIYPTTVVNGRRRQVDGPPRLVYRAGEIDDMGGGFGMFFVLGEGSTEKEAYDNAVKERESLSKSKPRK